MHYILLAENFHVVTQKRVYLIDKILFCALQKYVREQFSNFSNEHKQIYSCSNVCDSYLTIRPRVNTVHDRQIKVFPSLHTLTRLEELKMADEMETIKWRLSNALRDGNTLPTWEALVSKVHKVTTTAAFSARYCFIRALAEDPVFDLQLHIEKDIFFTEIMKTFVDKRRGTASTDETRTVRLTIERYLLDFLNNYQCEKETIPELQSNLFLY